MNRLRKSAVSLLALVCAASIFTSTVFGDYTKIAGAGATGPINKISGPIQTGAEAYFDVDVVYKLPDTISDDQQISLIVDMGEGSVYDSYVADGSDRPLDEYATSAQARSAARNSAV